MKKTPGLNLGGLGQKKIGGLGINLEGLKEKGANDFHDDFLAKYDEFSESWRQEVAKMRNH